MDRLHRPSQSHCSLSPDRAQVPTKVPNPLPPPFSHPQGICVVPCGRAGTGQHDLSTSSLSLPAGSVPASCHPLRDSSALPRAALGAVEERPEEGSSTAPGTSSKHLWLVSAGGGDTDTKAETMGTQQPRMWTKCEWSVLVASPLPLHWICSLRQIISCAHARWLLLCQGYIDHAGKFCPCQGRSAHTKGLCQGCSAQAVRLCLCQGHSACARDALPMLVCLVHCQEVLPVLGMLYSCWEILPVPGMLCPC